MRLTHEILEEAMRLASPRRADWSRTKNATGPRPWGTVDKYIEVEDGEAVFVDIYNMGRCLSEEKDRGGALQSLSAMPAREDIVAGICEAVAEGVMSIFRKCRKDEKYNSNRLRSICNVADLVSPGWGKEIAAFTKKISPK